MGPKLQEVDPTGQWTGAEVRLTNWSLHIFYYFYLTLLEKINEYVIARAIELNCDILLSTTT